VVVPLVIGRPDDRRWLDDYVSPAERTVLYPQECGGPMVHRHRPELAIVEVYARRRPSEVGKIEVAADEAAVGRRGRVRRAVPAGSARLYRQA
jgi:hypothetical protein